MKNYITLARLNKPFAILLLFCPCLWGLAINLGSVQNFSQVLYYTCILFAGSVLARSFGCVVNDICDEKIDAKTARTKNRPIANGKISKQNAIYFALFLALLCCCLLPLLPIQAAFVCVLALPLICIYPLAKKFTNLPQLVLGFVFNLGIFVAHFCITNKLSLQICMLYAVAILWTIIYDTIYAMQDLQDDKKNGTKSITIFFGGNEPVILKNLLFLCFVVQVLLSIVSQNLLQFAIFTFAVMFLVAICVFSLANIRGGKKLSYNFAFCLSNLFGLIVLVALLYFG